MLNQKSIKMKLSSDVFLIQESVEMKFKAWNNSMVCVYCNKLIGQGTQMFIIPKEAGFDKPFVPTEGIHYHMKCYHQYCDELKAKNLNPT